MTAAYGGHLFKTAVCNGNVGEHDHEHEYKSTRLSRRNGLFRIGRYGDIDHHRRWPGGGRDGEFIQFGIVGAAVGAVLPRPGRQQFSTFSELGPLRREYPAPGPGQGFLRFCLGRR